ncbi:hypothetical protein [Sphingopyxis sp.]|uniref:hypothetical protein n=1 Tax=Sphingopyxis sp. TaxID=1908224 RepID=UPI0035AD8801
MTDEVKSELQTAIEGLPFEMQLGFDVPRTWATAVQFFANPGHVLVVFREQVTQQADDGKANVLAKNVASVVMPLDVAQEMHKILGRVLSDLEKNVEG